MASYYYLMAQLPAILPASPIAFSSDAFKELASRFLSARDSKALASLTLEPGRSFDPSDSSFLTRWYERERTLRLALAKARSSKLKREAGLSVDEDESIRQSSDAASVAKQALALDNPLEAERYLDGVRLSWVDALSMGHYFDSDAVFAYAIRLMLRERQDRFTAEAGREAYSSIYNQILGEQA